MIHWLSYKNQHVGNFDIPPFYCVRSIVHLLHLILNVGCFYVLTFPDCKFKGPTVLDSDGCNHLFTRTLSVKVCS